MGTEYVLLSKAAAFFPNRPSVASLWRWAIRGVRGVRLATIAIGGRRFVSRDAVNEFLEALNRRTADKAVPPAAGEASARTRRAAATLDAAGF